MAKVVLGKPPKTFKPIVVTFLLPDGEEASIEVTYKYRTRTEFGQLIDEIFKDAGAKPADNGDFSMEALMAKTRDKNAGYLARVVDSWNLDEAVSIESLSQLANEIPAAASALMDAYRLAANEGRLGN